MRELKFRAFGKGTMSEPFSLGDAKYTVDDNGIHWAKGVVSFDIESDYILMQFTGLLDRNGKEIYEGDIVLLPDSEITPITDDGRGPEEPMSHLSPVEFHKGCFGLKVLEDSGTFHKGFWSFDSILNGEGYKTQDLEVIGNIYENPELLKP